MGTDESRGAMAEVLYQSADGALEIAARITDDTVWLTLPQLATLFGVQVPAVSKHVRNIYASGELQPEATLSKMETVRHEGSRTVRRMLEHYNLDVIISVGYRVNSAQATRFRIWATGVLKEHLTRGTTVHVRRLEQLQQTQRTRFEQNARELEATLALVRKASSREVLSGDEGRGLVDVIARYTQTFLLLQRYDEGLLIEPHGEPGGTMPTLAEARALVGDLRAQLMARSEAGQMFGQERGDGFAGTLGNLEQSVFGEPAYPTLESKAAHLLYFVIKNHPFGDGNKRIASLLFVDFLHRNGRLMHAGEPVINDIGLAALALLVAESDPKDKDVMIRLVMNMLAEPGATSVGHRA
ncbi:MAG: RhuM family protein [Metallibacterium scheffleri]